MSVIITIILLEYKFNLLGSPGGLNNSNTHVEATPAASLLPLLAVVDSAKEEEDEEDENSPPEASKDTSETSENNKGKITEE